MSNDIVFNEELLNVVDEWSKNAKKGLEEPTITYEKRPLRLGLGAKYVPHKKDQANVTSSKLLKKIKKDKSKLKQKQIDINDDESESDEDLSRLQALSKNSKNTDQPSSPTPDKSNNSKKKKKKNTKQSQTNS